MSSEGVTGGPMHVEHITPEALNGPTTLENLAYACARCNIHKGSRTRYRDPVSGRFTPLFNPRTQNWSRHFRWSADGTRIHGRTLAGRATIIALSMNHPTITMARGLWAALGIHPPQDV